MNNEMQKIERLPVGSGFTVDSVVQLVSSGIDLDKLERVIDLYNSYQDREARKAYFDALSRFQAKCPEVERTQTATISGKDGGPGYTYKYANIADIVKSIKLALGECGLCFHFEQSMQNQVMQVTCVATHVMGHSEQLTLTSTLDSSGGKNAIQMIGSTSQYLRRYTLCGLLGIVTAEEDDDGQAETKNFHDFVENAEPLDFLEYYYSLQEQVRSNLYNSFKPGDKVKGKQRVNDKLKAAEDQINNYVDAMEQYVMDAESDSIRELQGELAGYEKVKSRVWQRLSKEAKNFINPGVN